jgi:hypothetical protein
MPKPRIGGEIARSVIAVLAVTHLNPVSDPSQSGAFSVRLSSMSASRSGLHRAVRHISAGPGNEHVL